MWLLILFKNFSNLPATTADNYYSPTAIGALQQQEERKIMRHKIYGNDKRRNIKENHSTSNRNPNQQSPGTNKYNQNYLFRGWNDNSHGDETNDNDVQSTVPKLSEIVGDKAIRQQHTQIQTERAAANTKRQQRRRRAYRIKNPEESSPSLSSKNNKNDIRLLLPKPVIVMGFPKAGTSSIFSFFQRQGLNSQHWYCCEGKLTTTILIAKLFVVLRRFFDLACFFNGHHALLLVY